MKRGTALKACLFATGLAGIVAEYVMATLASYLLGDAVLHWTLIISLMLFAMGVGSRLSASLREPLLDIFVGVELALSVLVAASAPLVWALAVRLETIALAIYALSFVIGLLIGLELPLVARLNETFEELRLNIASVVEKDYYGALAGGLFFAFVALPHLGLARTPIALGAINFAVACFLFLRYRDAFRHPRRIAAGCLLAFLSLATLAVVAEPIVRWGEQRKYRDVVVHQEQTRFQRIVLTRWQDDHWLYLDGNEQWSSFDEHLYHEPLVHPALLVAASTGSILVLGGGEGLAVREILKHPGVEKVTVVELDPAITRLAREHPAIRALHQGALDDPRVRILHQDAYAFLLEEKEIYDAVVIDLPDPKTLELARLFSRPFYELLDRHLGPGGVIVTQATSPFFSRRAFLSILVSLRAAGFTAVPYHNHIPTMGEWGWVIGMKKGRAGAARLDEEALQERLLALDFDRVETRFLHRDAMISMLHFGKGMLDDLEEIEVSEESNPAVFRYYRSGDWDLY